MADKVVLDFSKAQPIKPATGQQSSVTLDFSQAQPIDQPGEAHNQEGNRIIVPKDGESFADTMQRAQDYGATVSPEQIHKEMRAAPAKEAEVLLAAPAMGAAGAAGLAGTAELSAEAYQALKTFAGTPAGKKAIAWVLHGALGAVGFKSGSKLLDMLLH